jgi:hypothetical protein
MYMAIGGAGTEERNDMLPVHPGRVLKRELAARDLSANRLALALRLPSGGQGASIAPRL